MLSRAVIILASISMTIADDPFCYNGVSWPPQNMTDLPSADVDVIVAQAPLFSNVQLIGDKLGWWGMFHTALVFRQTSNGTTRFWTLEFDAAHNVVDAVLPMIVNGTNGSQPQLVWRSDARYCLTEDSKPLLGRWHWTKTYKVAAVVNKQQLHRTFQDVVWRFNGTEPGTGPQYQLWGYVPEVADMQIKDVMCADGVAWVLHYLASNVAVEALAGLHDYRGTTLQSRAYSLEIVNMSDANESAAVVAYYELQIELVRGNSAGGGKASWLTRILDVFAVVPMQFVHDANTKTYYRVIGQHFPYFRAVFPFYNGLFVNMPFESPPFPPSNVSAGGAAQYLV